jgi:hypothetical protein
MSIGASAISGMTMARLHAVTGSRWRRTVRIAGKNAISWFRLMRAASPARGQCGFLVEPGSAMITELSCLSKAETGFTVLVLELKRASRPIGPRRSGWEIRRWSTLGST